MARKPPASPMRYPAKLSADQMQSGIVKLERRIDELTKLDVNNIKDGDDPAVAGLGAAIENTLSAVFGPGSHEYVRLVNCTALDQTDYNFSILGYGSRGGPSPAQIREGIGRGRDHAIVLLRQAVKSLREQLEDFEPIPRSAVSLPAEPRVLPNEIFVVHGHDGEAKQEVARFLERAELTPIILHEQASGGRTVIEKLEHYSNVGFAVVLVTPDDIGGPIDTDATDLKPRARQNVIAELFYFLGKLGRANVCALKKGDIEIPSDIGGVIYVAMDDAGGWKTDLLRELDAAGYKIDWAKALR